MPTFLIAFRFAVLMMVIGGLVYPFTMTALGQFMFPVQANGSLIKSEENGGLIGSPLIGQNFTTPEYFHPRPSVNGYDAANSGGANLGATSKKLIEYISLEAQKYQDINHSKQAVPIDAVTTSASGLDPHISVANALTQVPRIAVVRRIPPKAIEELIHQLEESTFPEASYVNVLRLNLALDRHTGKGI